MKETAKIFLLVTLASLVLFIALIVLILVLVNTKSPRTNDSQPQATTSQRPTKFRGVSFSPKSSGAEDFTAFFSEAALVGNALTWAGDWSELTKGSGAPFTIAKLGKQYDYEPIVLVGTHIGGKELKPSRELNNETKQLYIKAVKDFSKNYQPHYFVMGVEVNRVYEQDPQGFDFFVSLFSDATKEIKKVSKNTKVVTVFQLEKIKGLSGGLYGGTNDLAKNQWFLLERFPDADLIGFTTYPFLIYKDPREIPTDYYSEIKTKTTKGIIFTEIGWTSGGDNIVGWESSEDEQAEFVSRFFSLTEVLESEILVWSFLYDTNFGQPFNNIGLIKSDGTKKKAWEVWKNLVSDPIP